MSSPPQCLLTIGAPLRISAAARTSEEEVFGTGCRRAQGGHNQRLLSERGEEKGVGAIEEERVQMLTHGPGMKEALRPEDRGRRGLIQEEARRSRAGGRRSRSRGIFLTAPSLPIPCWHVIGAGDWIAGRRNGSRIVVFGVACPRPKQDLRRSLKNYKYYSINPCCMLSYGLEVTKHNHYMLMFNTCNSEKIIMSIFICFIFIHFLLQ